MKRLLLLTLLAFCIGIVKAQTPKLNALRIKTANSHSVEDSLSLCHAFAQNGMIDSARYYLNMITLDHRSTVASKVSRHLSIATLESFYGNIEKAINHYDSIFHFLDFDALSIKQKNTAFIQTLKAYSYNVQCEKGLELANSFLEHSLNEGLDSLTMISYTYVAQFRECLEVPDSLVERSISKAKEVAIEHPELQGPLYYELGQVHYYFEHFPAAIESFLAAENSLDTTKQRALLFELYISFSDAYDRLNNFIRSKQYLYSALQAKPPSISKLGDFYNVFGWTFYRLDELDSAQLFFIKSKNAYAQYQPGNPDIAYPIGNLGLIYRKLGKLDSAIYFSNLAKELFEEMGYMTGAAEALNNLGFIALTKGKPQKAIGLFEQAKYIALEYDDKFEEMNALEGMIEAYSNTDSDKALTLYPSYLKLKLHFQSKEDALQAMQKEAAFYEARSQDEIKELQLESELKSLIIEKKNFRIAAIGLGLILALTLAGIFYFYWYQHQKLSRSLQESNEINQRIISMISHDFRGPLNNIKLSLELVQSEDIELNEFTVLAKDLYRQSSEVALMFDSFVGWAMSQKDGYTPFLNQFEWSEVINEVIIISEPLAQLKQISIKVIAKEDATVHTDRMAISLILRNLIANAIKYSHKASLIEIAYTIKNRNVITHIIDHGIGMSEDHLHKILTTGGGSSLGTNKEYGAGLGLRMVIKYINGLGGSISATSKENTGTTFTISIPTKRG